MKRLTFAIGCALIAVVLLAGTATLAQTSYEFKLGFKALTDQIGAVAGTPLENEHYGPNEASLQQTTTGLMVWRKADNWTGFTDGSRTWINGLNGVQVRGNDERFDWEAQAQAAPPVPATPVPATAPTPPPAATTAPTPPPAATAAATTTTAGSSKDACLACHGPFDKLVSASANYVWQNGDKQSPHRYVPHASTDIKDIPECSNCHKPHPVPPTASDIAAMAKPDPSWCFGCHHTGTLQCGTCHAIP